MVNLKVGFNLFPGSFNMCFSNVDDISGWETSVNIFRAEKDPEI